jgi:hypothetical protein
MAVGDPLVSTSVIEEAGRFVVVLDVVFPDGAVRHRLQTYHSRSRALLAADFFRRTADRDPRPEWGIP